METKKTVKTKMDLLTAVEMIVDLSKDSKLEPEFFTQAARPIKYISKKMGLTKEQSVLMALFIDN
ncbi:MAG: AAA family ATPase, partial [Bacteroidales bacterium]|nr:AAA family ATPase [Bacteroidales bacterium]